MCCRILSCKPDYSLLFTYPCNHVLQAAEVGLFSPLKLAWQKQLKQWQMAHIDECLTKKEFPGLFKSAWNQVAMMENASNGFRQSGLFPLSTEGIDTTKLGPSEVAYAPKTENSNKNEALSDTNDIGIGENDSRAAHDVSHRFTEDYSVDIPLPQSIVQTAAQLPGPSGDTNSNPMPAVSPTPACAGYNNRWNHSYISPAFCCLNIPEPKQKKPSTKIRDKLPKALLAS